MSNIPANLKYTALVDKIIQIYTQANQKARQAVSGIRTQAYWEIGKYIVEVEQARQSRAQYGEKLLERLSLDLSERLGSGFSETNLKYMRQFFVTHPSIRQAPDELSWTQHTQLLSVKDDAKRMDLERRCIENDWKSRDLARIIKEERIETEKFSSEAKKAEDVSLKKSGCKLKYTRGRPGLFKVTEHKGLQVPKGMKSLDLGFHIYKTDAPGISKFKHGYIVRMQAPSPQPPVSSPQPQVPSLQSPAPGSLYTYIAYLERVIDGDTIIVDVDCGFSVMTRQRLRFRGIDAPELSTKRGQMAREYVERALKSVEFLIIRTHGTDIYDRYLVDVFYLEGENDPAVVAEKGKYLNQELLDEGLAKIYIARG